MLDEVEYMTADREDKFIVAQANEPIGEDGRFLNAKVAARHREEIMEIARERADYMDISPKMVVSIATAMIPFLENDDANRALMGSNMQRQGRAPDPGTEAPIVGTGMEYKAALDSGVCIIAKEDGVVTDVTARQIEVLGDSGLTTTYRLTKFVRSNQGTCMNQRPIVSTGQRVRKGEVLARRPIHRQRRAGARPQRPDRVHDLGGL